MSLSKYKSKRSFDKTPEPTGGKPVGNQLRFVVQKHHASHLHYDFRLEMEGVLKSWAVPKGPSMNPDDKRLAMMVEDHPWNYRDFEGIIPSGYGAGTVIVWDEGTYEPVDKKKTKKENDKTLLHHLYQGKLSFILKGKKLKGEFTLVKTKGRGENAWLLMKHEDRYAVKSDITEKDKSVLSGKTLEQVKAHPAKKWESHGARKTTEKKKVEKEVDDTIKESSPLITEGKKAPFPKDIKPMLCTLVKKPFEDPDYLYELKLDGYRSIAFLNKGKVILKSRSGLDYTKKYPSIETALQSLKINAVLDGEIVALNEKGQPDFDALQKNDGSLALAYYAFDILWCGGYNLMQLTYEKRKQILAESIDFDEVIKYSDHFEKGLELFGLIKKQELEGIVAKKKTSTYQPGKRNSDWLKMPTEKRQEFVIGGWTESEKGTPFASLLFGYYEGEKLIYQGHAGGGFKEKEKRDILKKLKSLEIKECPFANEVDTDRSAHWVKPELVANIKFATYTASGKIRKPAIFLGFREDKRPEQVVKETAVDPAVIEEKNDSKKKRKRETGSGNAG